MSFLVQREREIAHAQGGYDDRIDEEGLSAEDEGETDGGKKEGGLISSWGS